MASLALSIIGKVDWIDSGKLAEFILDCQDGEDGGISDRPGNMADVFHTFFGVAGLSLLGWYDANGHTDFRAICPVYALPEDLVTRMQLERSSLG